MASQLVQAENLPIYRGSSLKEDDISKSKKNERRERKALGDISKFGKVLPNSTSKGSQSTLKEKSTIVVSDASKNTTSSVLIEEESNKCKQWAEEGIEYFHFTGNDMLEFERKQQEQKIEKDVEDIMGAFYQWQGDMFKYFMLPNVDYVDDDNDMEVITKLELEIVPELPDYEVDCPCRLLDKVELDFKPFSDSDYELKLKDEYESDG